MEFIAYPGFYFSIYLRTAPPQITGGYLHAPYPHIFFLHPTPQNFIWKCAYQSRNFIGKAVRCPKTKS